MDEDVFELYMKAKEAYDAIPKQPALQSYHKETDTIRISCPNCGAVFAEIKAGWGFRFHKPTFCCGKLLV